MLVTERCVVALETSCGRDGARLTECDDVGRVERDGMLSCGRGGSGGGVPSLDGEVAPLHEGLREALPMMLSVGLAKSGCSTPLSPFFGGASSTAGAEGSIGVSPVNGWRGGSACADSDMEQVSWRSHGVWAERCRRCGRIMVPPRRWSQFRALSRRMTTPIGLLQLIDKCMDPTHNPISMHHRSSTPTCSRHTVQ